MLERERRKVEVSCNVCGESYPLKRRALGFLTCLECGELQARKVRHTIVPMHKSNYVVISDPTLLVGVNVKSGR